MIFVAAIILGAFVGWRRAARRGGNRLDKIQYAATHAIFFAILGLFATILYYRLT
ncbi:hypothetical protein DEA8626_01881 [Defluviimonas aquaemixtae]|uniref:Uncharacterized protein n=1 Tax=Albidovulum aquaemixtae TaxID=1542388 RepID=A0A2R8B6Z7_9RHOB|nr:hypothetical protein [Defluviimonas aquaemixtae]SPH18344.1 hypothetical protein DEA8626_01881 [Defluviimonas aquaemixtae]